MRTVPWILFWDSGLVFRCASAAGSRFLDAFPWLRRSFKRRFYDLLSAELERVGVRGVRCLNYGYAYAGGQTVPFELEPEDRREGLCSWNLIWETVRPVRLQGRRVLVVGCGRGGDAYALRRYLAAAEVVGLDFSRKSIEACRGAYALPGLTFEVGDAERIPFPAAGFDAAVSIESSHGYGDLTRFYREVARVLRPGGLFLYSDYFRDERFRQGLRDAGLRMIEEQEITDGVLRACRQGQPAREELIQRLAPPSLRGAFREWIGSPGSRMVRLMERGVCRYRRFVLERP